MSKYIFFFVFFVAQLQFFQAQTTNGLEGLHKATPAELSSITSLALNPSAMPIYNEKLERLTVQTFGKLMSNMKHVPEPYMDSSGVIQAVVMRKATAEELKQMRDFQKNGPPPPAPDGAFEEMASPQINTPAPAFELTDIHGKKYNLAELSGKIVVLNFWFIECKPCVQEIPDLNDLVKTYEKEGVLFIALGLNDAAKITAFLKKTPFDYQMVSNASDIAKQFGVDGFPTSYVIDQKGIIKYVSLGVSPQNKANLAAEIAKLL
jgi:peroxiredoxin